VTCQRAVWESAMGRTDAGLGGAGACETCTCSACADCDCHARERVVEPWCGADIGQALVAEFSYDAA
jgi:hypothetical protein